MPPRPVTYLGIAFLIASVALVAAGEDEPHWSYTGEDGPDHWAELSPDWGICAKGKNQSPIDVVTNLDANLPELIFDYKPNTVREINNGRSIQEQIQPGSFLRFNDQKVELLQFHFHVPSEHTVNGRSYPMEAHLVHQDQDGELAVVGVLFEQGESNPLVEQLWANLPVHRGEEYVSSDKITINELLPSRREYYTYTGSLTTPPCSEGVLWIVLEQPVRVSKKQIRRFVDVMGTVTNRPVQPAHLRTIIE